MDKKPRVIYMCYLQDTQFTSKYIQTESKGIQKDISWKWGWKTKTAVAKLMSYKTDFLKKAIMKGTKRYHIR